MLKKSISAVFVLILALSLIFSLTACEAMSAISAVSDMANDLQKYEDAIKKLTNYKITIETVSESGDKQTMTEMRCDKGYASIAYDNITYVEYGKGKMYILNKSDKTGYSYTLDSDDSYKGFGLMITGYLYMFEAYKYLGAKKSGSDKVAGRKATSYTYSNDGTDYKFWIDDEYGLTLKFTVKSESGTSTSEVTEFKTKGVTLSDMANLKDYDIQEFSY